MTKLLLCSDLHTNFHRDGGKSIINSLHNADVIVIAGDLSIITNSLLQNNIETFCNKFPEVVFVTGNHSYYYASFKRLDDILNDLEKKLSNFTWLNDTRKIVAGVSFIGGTLWFPDSSNVQKYKHCLNDFACIKDFEPEVFDRHNNTVEFLKNNIQEGDVVVTHHAPSYKSVGLKYKNSKLNCFFACDLNDLIIDKKPSLMLHGHMHGNCDYMIDQTRIVCNPFAYPGENLNFNDSCIIEV